MGYSNEHRKEYSKEYRKKNLEHVRALARKSYYKNLEERRRANREAARKRRSLLPRVERMPRFLNGEYLCSHCREYKDKLEFSKNKSVKYGLFFYCKKCSSVLRKARWQCEKDTVLNHYGRKCYCCGEHDDIFLTIDHIKNDGKKHRIEIGTGLYRWLIKNNFPEGFQVACYNCNIAKYKNGGECPGGHR